MTILTGDVKLLAAERLLDTPDGGGRMTGQVLVDGQANNLFPDISELDRTYGRVSLRKTYVAILTDDSDAYYGSHVIVADAPDDPRVSVTLFTTRSWTDQRDDARDRIERYLARSVKWPGQLLERQLTGQRAISLLLKPSDPLPRVGQALVLVQDEGKPTEREQYVRLTRITTVNRQFTISSGSSVVNFDAVVATCEISDPLRYDFEGPPPSNRDDVAGRAVVRDTVVANAAVYYGIASTVADAEPGAVKIQVTSLFGQLVPSAQSETPLVDATIGNPTTPLIESGSGSVSLGMQASIRSTSTLTVGTGILPSSLTLSADVYVVTDKAGVLYSGTTAIGTVDYPRGVLRFSADSPNYSGPLTLKLRFAAAPTRVADTAAIAIGPDNRGYAYTITLAPTPQPASLTVSYMAQGQWYDLSDLGDGRLRGSDAAFGTGTIDYVTGSVVLTTGALPDANSAILLAWGSGANALNRSQSPISAPALRFTLSLGAVRPSSLRIRWTDGSRNYLATDRGDGILVGHGQGSVRYSAGDIRLIPQNLPAGGTTFTIDYDAGPPEESTFTRPPRNPDGSVTLQLPHFPIQPNTLELEFNIVLASSAPKPYFGQQQPNLKTARDDGNGHLDSGINGTINYATGELRLFPTTEISTPVARYQTVAMGSTLINGRWQTVYRSAFSHFDYPSATAILPVDDSAFIRVNYRPENSPTSVSETVTLETWQVDLTEGYAERIVAGSVRFIWGNKTYVDRQGTLVTDVQPATGAGTFAGTLDYASGRALISVWQPAATNQLSIQSLLTDISGQPVDEVSFRIPATPVRPGSVQIRAVPVGGNTISATAQNDGHIQTSAMLGSVDYQTGVVRVRFGHYVPAAGNEGASWYNSDAVVTTTEGRVIFQPNPVFADTVRFNAVAYTYLPLSADIVGLDPVRLPPDGQVPIFRPGDVVVVHHTDTTQLPAVQQQDVIVPLRPRLSALRITDSAGTALPPDRYQADLDAGQVILKAPLTTTGLTLPLLAEHRIEDMALVSDTQINGVLTLTRPLTHHYPAQNTRVSSALIIGDLQARAHTLFAQQTWTGEWSDNRLGAATIAQYNDTVYPLHVTNRGALEERWALIFTNTTEFRVIGESVGQIAQGNTATDIAPTNPDTHAPYFKLSATGWGSGWSAGNVLRFNTSGANFPLWLARTVLQGPPTNTQDTFALHIRGDINR